MKSITVFLIAISLFGCSQKEKNKIQAINTETVTTSFEDKLSRAAISIIDPTIDYDSSYFSIKYPNGDIPKNKGVCTDVVIRAYRKLGIDLQKEVHEDMKANFSEYPNLKKWGMTKTDTNIDHRRVPNLEVFFERKGIKLPVSENADDYKTGEIVTWMINGKLPHIGIITNKKSHDGKRNLIVHNIGGGQDLEDCLFSYEIVGHYKYERKL
ncbi:DUF1287 domain-containing protein [Flavobacterium aquicola]|uniref:DUF1287 domain-containing protein n=1 Tax=Flavobacterium aquicola TaxID=1682742 RepID=A0A3E0EIU1_9FLAO|nr:DUF1287 domain-containing protein [Flavobacterium aquicola]REG98174.1 hypothetical protein C8P67_107100 [Flavobacterium aquicola]